MAHRNAAVRTRRAEQWPPTKARGRLPPCAPVLATRLRWTPLLVALSALPWQPASSAPQTLLSATLARWTGTSLCTAGFCRRVGGHERRIADAERLQSPELRRRGRRSRRPGESCCPSSTTPKCLAMHLECTALQCSTLDSVVASWQSTWTENKNKILFVWLILRNSDGW